jgi:predicted Zn-ribbon and HTH transcriptional regulator
MLKTEEKELKELDIKYDPQLVDDIVYKGLADREAKGDYDLYMEYHKKRDAIYELEPEMRPKKFRELDSEFFKLLGYDGYVSGVFGEFPNIKEIVEEVHVRRATTRQNEGSNVVDEGRKLIIRLYPELFLTGEEISKVMRHELMHVSDIMDKSFGYQVEDFDPSPMEDRIIRDRYRLFWDIYVDGRLEKMDKETLDSRESKKREFDAFFKKIPDDTREQIFNRLWGADEPLTHERIVELSRDINKVLSLAEVENKQDESGEALEKIGPLPGTTCPLCGFPSFDWIEEVANDEEMVRVLKEDFPDWEPHDGVCARCTEYYKIKAGKW